MKKISFTAHVLPHVLTIAVFLIVTLFFFKPIFFENKALQQHDIQQFLGSAKTIIDYREQTGEEALWVNNMFSGMPAYLVSVQWGNVVIGYLKRIISFGLPHPVSNIFLSFLCFYLMLLAFGVRPFLAMGGALAFGLSSYMIVGLMAGHNARIGAIAFMPLVIAGIHLVFKKKWTLGFGVTTAALALHLRENHLQITYYMMIIVLIYGILVLIDVIREKTFADFGKSVAIIVVSTVLAAGAFFGPFWAVTEYQKYSTRGKSELTSPKANEGFGSKSWAFDYSNGILEPFVLFIPNFYGGSSSNYLVQDRDSETYKALARANNEQLVNQLVNYTSAYWGEQGLTAPYYAGAVIVFFFAIGIAFAERKYVWWLVTVSAVGIMLSWGQNFASFNYFLFDYLPGYNKFRSVTFTLLLPLFAMPLLGMLGVEKLWSAKYDKTVRRKLLIAFGSTAGLCLLLLVFSGAFAFTREFESQLPIWFIDALADDRKDLFISDVLRTFTFITAAFIPIYFELHNKLSPTAVYAFLTLLIVIDIAIVDKRYLTEDLYKRKRDNSFFAQTEADQAILQDKSYYRVYNLESPFQEARTSYYHNSVGGYHGAKLKRYQDFYDSCLVRETRQMISAVQSGEMDFEKFNVLKMLNIKYIVYGPSRGNIITNTSTNGPAWFARDLVKVNSANDELSKTCSANSLTAVVDESKFHVGNFEFDSAASVKLTDRKPSNMKYGTESSVNGLVVFSEVYYPGWRAFVDGKEQEIKRVNYILRALEVPAGKHTIEFRFEPKPYMIGNMITTASSWLVLLILVGSVFMELRTPNHEDVETPVAKAGGKKSK